MSYEPKQPLSRLQVWIARKIVDVVRWAHAVALGRPTKGPAVWVDIGPFTEDRKRPLTQQPKVPQTGTPDSDKPGFGKHSSG